MAEQTEPKKTKIKQFEFDFVVRGITRQNAENILLTIKSILEFYDGTMGGGMVETEVDDEG